MRMLFPLAGLLLALVGIPFYLEKVKPNRWSGVRLPKTYADPAVWYAANKVMGQNFIIAGASIFVLTLAVLLLAQYVPSLQTTRINTGILLVALAGAVFHTYLAVTRM